MILGRNLALLAVAVLTAACSTAAPLSRAATCVDPGQLPRLVETEGEGAAVEVSVLIYNVEGLPWPARGGRGASLDAIGTELARLYETGEGPDIVMLQEVFSRRAGRIADRAGYPNVAPGPTARARRQASGADVPREFRQKRRFLKGEKTAPLMGSGLVVLSKYPLTEVFSEPFSRAACAGFDCLSNKGVMLARVAVPGAPAPVDVFTTHMNAQNAARVAPERTLLAHQFQTDESATFLARVRDDANPLIFGGDFNMRNAPDRLDHFTYRKPYHIVRHYCSVVVDDCDVKMSWDGDAPWLDTQDLQGFDDGASMNVRPIRAEAMFDGPATGGLLSDHDGYLVTYRLSFSDRDGVRLVERARKEGRGLCLNGREDWSLASP